MDSAKTAQTTDKCGVCKYCEGVIVLGVMYKLTIPGTLPGLNEYINAERRNKYAAATIKKQCEAVVMGEAKRQLKHIKLKTPVIMRYRWIEKDRRRDKDNISGYGRKIIQDGLVRAGYLPNDGWNEIDSFTDDFAVDKQKPRVEIEIEEVTP